MLIELNLEHFDHIFDLMEASFPTDEYRKREEQKLLFSEPAYRVYGIFDDTNQGIVCFICCWNFENILYIEHFAVNPAYRNAGLGSRIIQEIPTISHMNLTDGVICLEVEPPETDDAIRRIEFYKRNGYFINEFEYVQPPLSSGKAPVKLMIMTYGKSLTELEFQELKHILYKRVYKVKLK